MANTKERPKPSARAQAREQMTRADSLQSMQKYGRIVPPSQQPKPKPKKKGFFGAIRSALGGK